MKGRLSRTGKNMKLLYLTENCNMIINTEHEKLVLTRMIRDHKIGEAKINNTYIYLCSDPLGKPDVQNNKVRVLLKYMDKTYNFVEETTWLDITYIMNELENIELSSERDGNFSYIDWESEYITISTNNSFSPYNSRIQFKLHDIPELDSRNTVIYGEPAPWIDNIGVNDNNIFKARIRSKHGRKNNVLLTVNMNEPLDSLAVII